MDISKNQWRSTGGEAARFFDDLALTLLSNSSCTNLSYTSFFIPQKRASQGLTVAVFQLDLNNGLSTFFESG